MQYDNDGLCQRGSGHVHFGALLWDRLSCIKQRKFITSTTKCQEVHIVPRSHGSGMLLPQRKLSDTVRL